MYILTEKKTLVKELWDAGVSYELIAEKIGNGVTRNSIAGFCFRNGWKRRKAKVKTTQVKKRIYKTINKTPKSIREEKFFSVEKDLEIPENQRKKLLELRKDSCHWPVGDPKTGEFFFCGGDKQTGSVYCKDHSNRAYRPKQQFKSMSFGRRTSQLRRA